MLLDEKYSKYLWHYKTGNCRGPGEYTFKKNGFRLLYGKEGSMCEGCGKHWTHWFILYFDPRERFREWSQRNKHSRMICSVEDIDAFLAHVLMERVKDVI